MVVSFNRTCAVSRVESRIGEIVCHGTDVGNTRNSDICDGTSGWGTITTFHTTIDSPSGTTVGGYRVLNSCLQQKEKSISLIHVEVGWMEITIFREEKGTYGIRSDGQSITERTSSVLAGWKCFSETFNRNDTLRNILSQPMSIAEFVEFSHEEVVYVCYMDSSMHVGSNSKVKAQGDDYRCKNHQDTLWPVCKTESIDEAVGLRVSKVCIMVALGYLGR